MYDVTIKSSFKNLDCWMKELKCYITDPADVNRLILILVGNKCDKGNRVIEFDQGQLWARENGFYFFEASAQTDDGVTKLFELMFKSLVELLETGARPKSTGKTLGVYFLVYFSCLKNMGKNLLQITFKICNALKNMNSFVVLKNKTE